MSIPHASTRSRMIRTAAAIAAGVAGALVLTGCIKVEADVTVASDATASGTFGFELQKEAAGFLGITDAGAFEEQLETGDLSEEEGLSSFDDCTASESDTGFVYTCAFTDTPFTDSTDLWTITKEDSTIVFRMVNEGDDSGAGDLGLGEGSLGSVSVDVTFPGPITSISGAGATQTSDTTATVEASMTDALDISIRSEDGASGFPVATLIVVLVAAGVILLIVVVAGVLIARRRHTHQTELPATEDQAQLPEASTTEDQPPSSDPS